MSAERKPKVRPRFSVIVPAYNAADTIGACLDALARQTFPAGDYEVIVVDDGSTDGTAGVAREHGVRVISQPNAGPAAARNRGAEAARGDVLLFTDADCEPTPGWISAFAEAFDANPDAVGAKGTYLSRQREIVARFTQLEYEERYARMAGRERIDFVDTYSAAYCRDAFLEAGGFDTTFPTASVEDQEFSFRMARLGHRMIYVPEAKVYHIHNRTIGAYWRRKFYIGYWKALVTRRFPERLVSDSHTPQVLKLQMGLVGVMVLTLPLLPFSGKVRKWWGGAALAFLATTFPFVRRAVGRDETVALAAPGLLAVRALALTAGFLAGMLRFWLDTDSVANETFLNSRGERSEPR